MDKLVSALAILILISAGVTKIIASQENSVSKQPDATPVQVGIMSERQKQHSKLFESGPYKTGHKLDISRQTSNSSSNSGDGPFVGPPFEVIDPNAPMMSFGEFLGQLSCQADAVVVVTVEDKSSQLTETREFIFTDYNAIVSEILKNNNSASIGPNSRVVVTRPGGKVEINDQIVSALDSSFQPLSTGRTYLLFLRYIPTTGAYQAIRKGSFLLRDGELTKLTEERVPGSNGKAQTFSNESRYAIQTCAQ